MIAESLPAAEAAQPRTQMVHVAPLPATVERPKRLVSLDAYRGFVMLLMISAGLGIPKIAEHFPASKVWQFLAHETDHAEWRGCTLWDLIQPSFMFIVGVAVPYSMAARFARGDSRGRIIGHALWRAFLLVVLGIFLSTSSGKSTEFIFTIVLAQIGLGYPFLALLGFTKPRTQAIAVVVLLLGTWAVFALSPVQSLVMNENSMKAMGLTPDWEVLHGFEAHWQKSANITTKVDQWLLNLFPRKEHFDFNRGGYQTLNFIPSLATMTMGLLAGGLLRSHRSEREKLRWLILTGVAALALGAIWDWSGLCPMVKRIWTPSFAVFSAGWALLLLAGFYAVIDVRGYRRWAFPFVVAGMNCIALYCMSMLMKPFIRERMRMHFGQKVFESFGEMYAPMVEMVTILTVLWLVAWWMYRRKIFLRI